MLPFFLCKPMLPFSYKKMHFAIKEYFRCMYSLHFCLHENWSARSWVMPLIASARNDLHCFRFLRSMLGVGFLSIQATLTYPHGDMGWLHGLLYDCYQLLAQVIQAYFIAQSCAECRERLRGIVLPTVEASVWARRRLRNSQ